MGTAALATLPESDGYTVAVMHNSVIRAPLVQKVNFDPLKDFTYLIGLFNLTTGICVAADAPWQTLGDLLADAKKRPGAISWGTVGAISINRIVAERLAKMAGTAFNMVPFKGGSEAFTALIGRHLDVYGDPGFGAASIRPRLRFPIFTVRVILPPHFDNFGSPILRSTLTFEVPHFWSRSVRMLARKLRACLQCEFQSCRGNRGRNMCG